MSLQPLPPSHTLHEPKWFSSIPGRSFQPMIAHIYCNCQVLVFFRDDPLAALRLIAQDPTQRIQKNLYLTFSSPPTRWNRPSDVPCGFIIQPTTVIWYMSVRLYSPALKIYFFMKHRNIIKYYFFIFLLKFCFCFSRNITINRILDFDTSSKSMLKQLVSYFFKNSHPLFEKLVKMTFSAWKSHVDTLFWKKL